MSFIPHTEWLQKQPPRDKVIITNLSTNTLSGTDAWGRKKVQPALISVVASLREAVSKQAESELAGSVHYGQMSKKILAVVKQGTDENAWTHGLALARLLKAGVYDANIDAYQVTVTYPKASLYGDGVSYTYCCEDSRGNHEAATLHLRNVRAPSLIGLNPHERGAKQIVIANLWFENTSLAEQLVSNNALERVLYKRDQSIDEAELKTLEGLADEVVSNIFRLEGDCDVARGTSVIRLRLEKPLAVPSAEAPAVEVYRTLKHDD